MAGPLNERELFVKSLCVNAHLPVSDVDLPGLTQSYFMIIEGTEALQNLEGYSDSSIFTLIKPRVEERTEE